MNLKKDECILIFTDNILLEEKFVRSIVNTKGCKIRIATADLAKTKKKYFDILEKIEGIYEYDLYKEDYVNSLKEMMKIKKGISPNKILINLEITESDEKSILYTKLGHFNKLLNFFKEEKKKIIFVNSIFEYKFNYFYLFFKQYSELMVRNTCQNYLILRTGRFLDPEYDKSKLNKIIVINKNPNIPQYIKNEINMLNFSEFLEKITRNNIDEINANENLSLDIKECYDDYSQFSYLYKKFEQFKFFYETEIEKNSLHLINNNLVVKNYGSGYLYKNYDILNRIICYGVGLRIACFILNKIKK